MMSRRRRPEVASTVELNQNVRAFGPSNPSMSPIDFDVVVVGAGPVGLGLVHALAGSDLKLGLVERKRANNAESEDWDARVYAISPANEAFLRDLRAWPGVAARMEPVTRMRIFGDDGRFSRPFEHNAQNFFTLSLVGGFVFGGVVGIRLEPR